MLYVFSFKFSLYMLKREPTEWTHVKKWLSTNRGQPIIFAALRCLTPSQVFTQSSYYFGLHLGASHQNSTLNSGPLTNMKAHTMTLTPSLRMSESKSLFRPLARPKLFPNKISIPKSLICELHKYRPHILVGDLLYETSYN